MAPARLSQATLLPSAGVSAMSANWRGISSWASFATKGIWPTVEELILHARTTIAGYKVPRSIDLRSEPLPLSAAMKVLKRELRAPFWAGKGRTIN